MDKERILKVISVWTEAEKTLLAGSEDGTWTHGKHSGSLEYLYHFKELLGVKDESKGPDSKTS